MVSFRNKCQTLKASKVKVTWYLNETRKPKQLKSIFISRWKASMFIVLYTFLKKNELIWFINNQLNNTKNSYLYTIVGWWKRERKTVSVDDKIVDIKSGPSWRWLLCYLTLQVNFISLIDSLIIEAGFSLCEKLSFWCLQNLIQV